MKAYQGRLKVHDPITVENGRQQKESPLPIPSWPWWHTWYSGMDMMVSKPQPATPGKDNVINWKSPATENWTVIMISTENGYMLHPDHGNLLVNEYFQEFEDHLSPEAKKGHELFLPG